MKYKLIYMALTLGLQSLLSCTPEKYTYTNNEDVDVRSVDSVVLLPNHQKLIADGHAQLDLRPVMYNKQGYQIPDSRVKEEWLEYTPSEGVTLTRHFSTSDPSLIGKIITTQVKIKGTNVESQAASFEIVAPPDKKYTSEITIPVIFHIIQTNEDIQSYGGAYESSKIEQQLEKINNLFAGTASVNPVGVNTHIRFQMAQYDPYGQKMLTPGINRLTIPDLDNDIIANHFSDFLTTHHLVWPAEKYMNIWLISDRKNLVNDFANGISTDCIPRYILPDTPAENRPGGIGWQEWTAGTPFAPNESGVIYKLQELDAIGRSFTEGLSPTPGTNELAFYIGYYFGLFPTCTYYLSMAPPVGTDYCDDTIDYLGSNWGSSGVNNTWNKTATGCYFRSENIMDDPTGLHVSVSKNQCERIRWVLEHCPERAAWKSNFAFTGE